MKFLLFVLVLMVVFAILSAVLISIFGNKSGISQPAKKNTRNYKVRFDAVAEKYYIVNELATHDEPVENWFGRRVMYADKPKAEFIVQKLNS
ncbi:hypothetical protein DQT32_04750 [Salmonella enterica subsp. enterica serovar Braenderup]|nr:hypothetical protein [Salmonella enterica subsp. enterica serovar Braenderup]